MTHDTPGEDTSGHRWCDTCGISVDPVEREDGLECPSCGDPL